MKTLAGPVDWNALEQITLSPNIAGHGLSAIISAVYPYIFTIAGLLMLFFIILSGYKYMVAGSDVKALETAKKNLTYAIVGFLVIFASYWVVAAIGSALGIHQITDMFP
jgi:hypothetical protein